MILKKIVAIILFLFGFTFGFSQSVNIGQIGKSKLVNVSGGVSMNAVLYSGDAARDPFTYFTNGNINVNIAGIYNLPFSFSYTSQKFGYTKPVLMNRLSIHPSYKWITAHIGDASMTFSPYTLSGYQFTGFGVDLTPQGKFKISAMYGRLLKSSEFDSKYPTLVPTYQRYGYGFKTTYALEKVNLGVTLFKAKDQINSLTTPFPFEMGVTPKENAAMSFEATFKLFKKMQVTTEYANSSVTEDSRVSVHTKSKGITSYLMNPNATTQSYNAFKTQLVYPAGKGTLGLGYERIDPNYRTLGGYFFNNDLENITVNASQSLYKDKVSVALNLGMQKDNLNQQKSSQMKRLVSAATVDIKASKKVNLNLTYSNFQSFTNSRNQFDYINQAPNTAYLDTLNFRQVNQNAGITMNYLIKNEKRMKQSLTANFTLQDALNQQQGKTIQGGASTFYNSAVSYAIGLPEKSVNITGAINNTYSKMETGNSLIIGPTAGISKLFFDKKLNTSFSSSYNSSFTNGNKINSVYNFRANSSYIYMQKHNFGFSAMALFRNTATTKNHDITATFSYSYSFDKIKVRIKIDFKTDDKEKAESILKISYKGMTLEGTKAKIVKQMEELQLKLPLLTASENEVLNKLINITRITKNDEAFKNKALDYLEKLDIDSEILKKYNLFLAEITKKLEKDIARKDGSMELAYVNAMTKVNGNKLHNIDPVKITDKIKYNSYLKLVERSEKNKNQLVNHRWMQLQFSQLAKMDITKLQENEFFKIFSNQEIEETFKMMESKKPDTEILQQLELKMIPYYDHLAAIHATNDEITLKYIIKTSRKENDK